jgi:biotin synthase
MRHAEIIRWLNEDHDERLSSLFAYADAVRRVTVGDGTLFRGLIEIGNLCSRHCLYCGIRAPNRLSRRYRMNLDDILETTAACARLGYDTVVLQAGEHRAMSPRFVEGVIRAIKSKWNLKIALSLGEQLPDTLALWRQAGADRYLLKHETSDLALYRRIHPSKGEPPDNRIRLALVLRALGYEVGGGIMTGIPGQTIESVAEDILLFADLELGMIALGPYIPHPRTPLGRMFLTSPPAAPAQAPNTPEFCLKAVALSRLACPGAHIPATSAIGAVKPSFRQKALLAGANVIMDNLTPPRIRPEYDIYPKHGTFSSPQRISIFSASGITSLPARPQV